MGGDLGVEEEEDDSLAVVTEPGGEGVRLTSPPPTPFWRFWGVGKVEELHVGKEGAPDGASVSLVVANVFDGGLCEEFGHTLGDLVEVFLGEGKG